MAEHTDHILIKITRKVVYRGDRLMPSKSQSPFAPINTGRHTRKRTRQDRKTLLKIITFC